LYAMSAGHSPFRTDNTMGVLRRICEDSPRPLREVNPDIPAWLALVVEKLLRKSPADRFQSAAEVAELLGQYLAYVQQPTLAPRPPDIEPARSSARPSRRWAAGAVAAGLAGAVVWVVASRLPDGTSTGPERAADARADARAGIVPTAKKRSAGGGISYKAAVDPIDAELADLEKDTAGLEEKILRFTPEAAANGDPLDDIQRRLEQLQQELAPAAGQVPAARGN
jgi:hypothetical protein